MMGNAYRDIDFCLLSQTNPTVNHTYQTYQIPVDNSGLATCQSSIQMTNHTGMCQSDLYPFEMSHFEIIQRMKTFHIDSYQCGNCQIDIDACYMNHTEPCSLGPVEDETARACMSLVEASHIETCQTETSSSGMSHASRIDQSGTASAEMSTIGESQTRLSVDDVRNLYETSSDVSQIDIDNFLDKYNNDQQLEPMCQDSQDREIESLHDANRSLSERVRNLESDKQHLHKIISDLKLEIRAAPKTRTRIKRQATRAILDLQRVKKEILQLKAEKNKVIVEKESLKRDLERTRKGFIKLKVRKNKH